MVEHEDLEHSIALTGMQRNSNGGVFWRTPDSHYGQTVRVNTHQVLQTANTTNKCRPEAHRAPINKLGIDYHQHCSSSLIVYIDEAVAPHRPPQWKSSSSLITFVQVWVKFKKNLGYGQTLVMLNSHGWGSKPIHIASLILILYLMSYINQSGSAPCYAVDEQVHPYTGPCLCLCIWKYGRVML